jgi:2-amino-4-hydroxy-6-hydroxymethyldihydropteridine diphosphokinase
MILIALGSNLSGKWGTPREMIERALIELARENIHVLRASTLIETAPFGVADQPHFVNGVASVETVHGPEDVMAILHRIEERAGRIRTTRWGPRTLDLDLIDYNGVITSPESSLTLPHPGIAERDFVLQPIAEIAPDWQHPVTRATAHAMLSALKRH